MWKNCCCCLFSREYEPPDVLELDYRHNSLDEVPPEIFTHERTLEKLLLGSNQIKDLAPNLFHCHELRELDLNDNEVKEIPAAIESLNRLAKLSVARNCLTDVPDSIKNCKNLTYLDLSINTLTKLPEVICQLVHLEELFLNETSLEFLPANFGRLTKLKTLELRENLLQTLPKSMNRLYQLQKLDIGSNDIEDLPEVIGTLANLTELWCDNNCIREVPKFIGNLTKLSCLDLSNNELHEISSDIGKCANLTDIAFSNNSLTTLPDAFTKLENVAVIRLNDNTLVRLPEDMGKLKNLQELNLISNVLRSLPPSIGLLRKLHTLYLDNNRLAELPKEIGSCTSLTVFSAVRNNLQEIPSEIGHLSNLKMLALTNNSIRNLPVSILGLANLGALWLTEGQNKPLVALNREICAETGQHVVTCCLLPQLPPAEVEQANNENANVEEPPRRSARRIRFEDIEESPPPSPEIPKPAVNGGLSRAPTPYPKELRALSKSASQIRQNKGQNGDATNISDEPVYEGDLIEEPKDLSNKNQYEMKMMEPGVSSKSIIHRDRLKDRFVSSKRDAMKHSYSMTDTHVDNKADLRATISEANVSLNTVGLPMGSASMQTPCVEEIATPVPPPLPTLSVGKTPPPYHIAAQRAAFFRSSGGAGTGRVFPNENVGGSNSSSSSSAMLTNQQNVPDISATNMSYPLPENIERKNQGVLGCGSLQEPNILRNDPYHERRPVETTDNPAFSETQTVQFGKQDIVDSKKEFEYSEVLSDNNANITSKPKYTLEGETNVNVGHMQDPFTNSAKSEDNENFKFSSSSMITEGKNELHQPGLSASTKVSMSKIPMSHSKRVVEQCVTPPSSEESRLSKIPSFGKGKRLYNAPPLNSNTVASISPTNESSPHSPSPLTNRAKIPVRKTALSMQYESGKAVTTSNNKAFNSVSRIMNVATPHDAKENVKRAAVSSGNLKYGNVNWAQKSEGAATSGIGKGSGTPVTSGGNDDRKGSSRIPRFGSGKGAAEDSQYPFFASSPMEEKRSDSGSHSSVNMSEKSMNRGVSPRQSRSGIPKPPSNTNVGALDPKVAFGRKPWIFGTHRNARVVSVEYRKLNANQLGFTIQDFSSQASPEGKGIYVTGTDSEDLPIKVGDKILQVDGIDVDADNMGVEIVNKILSNCRENIQFLVSRQQ